MSSSSSTNPTRQSHYYFTNRNDDDIIDVVVDDIEQGRVEGRIFRPSTVIIGNDDNNSSGRVDMDGSLNINIGTGTNDDDDVDGTSSPVVVNMIKPQRRDSVLQSSRSFDSSSMVSSECTSASGSLAKPRSIGNDKPWYRSKSRMALLVCFVIQLLLVFVIGLLAGMYSSLNNGNSPTPSASGPTQTTTPPQPPKDDYIPDDFEDEWDVDKELGEGAGTSGDYNTNHDGGADGSATTAVDEINSDFTVGVFYDPSVSTEVFRGQGTHYLRKDLEPKQYPSLGEYADGDSNVISEHLKMLHRANVKLLVTSWSGPAHSSDFNTKNVILSHDDMTSTNTKVALRYNTFNRFNGLEIEDDQSSNPAANIETSRTDTLYMCEHYFNHPNYYRINGRPVVVLDLSRQVKAVKSLEDSLLMMRTEAAKCGQNLYIVGDEVEDLPFWYFDAVTNARVRVPSTDVPSQVYADTAIVDEHFNRQSDRKIEASMEDCSFIPSVTPGRNDRNAGPDESNPIISRRLNAYSGEGSLFHYELEYATKLVDPATDNMILVNSFNDWAKDSQIEPVVGMDATTPYQYTQGMEYVAYGDLYLDILRAATLKHV